MEQNLKQAFVELVGAKNALDPALLEAAALDHYNRENRGIFVGSAAMVLKPASTSQVQEICKLAHQNDIAMVPQGGHTGHSAGGVADKGQIVVSLERMQRLRWLDQDNNAVAVDAGVILETLHDRADEADRLYPVSIAAKGSCRVGGTIATNAGGTGVIAYGNTRDQVLGLEVVLADGSLWDGMRALKKDNTGYDLKQLFIGSEGTLGFITGAVLRLLPKPKGRSVAFVALDSAGNALNLLNLLVSRCGKSLTAFEFMLHQPLAFTLSHQTSLKAPFTEQHTAYALLEFSSGISNKDAVALAETSLAEALEQDLCQDALIAQNQAQAADLWAIRETMPSAQAPYGWSIKHDISVAVNRMPEFFERAEPLVQELLPGARICAFGHMGDGNIHYNITQPKNASQADFLPSRAQVNAAVHQLVVEMRGSISAEHGIGLAKRDLLIKTKDPLELAMMRAVKNALDPKGLMNPGKVI